MLRPPRRVRPLLAGLFSFLGALAVAPALAEDAAEDLRYVELQPAFVTNFGVSNNGHLMYVKAVVSVRVAGPTAEAETKYHLPALRNEIVLLLSRQDETAMTTSEGREQLRKQALADLRAVLERETGDPQLKDLLFTNFLVQR